MNTFHDLALPIGVSTVAAKCANEWLELYFEQVTYVLVIRLVKTIDMPAEEAFDRVTRWKDQWRKR
jgi:hypothetical protein